MVWVTFSAGFISPSSAEGISYAIESAAVLSGCINGSFEHAGRLYKRRLWKLKLNMMFKWFKSLVMYNRVMRGLVMRSGILGMEVNEK